MSRALRLTVSELTNIKARAAALPTVRQMRDQPALKEARHQKYGNVKVTDNGIVFASKAEHKRWQYLVMLQRAKEISDLQLQVPFEVIPGMARPSGGRERPTVYIADFVYMDNRGRRVVEDVKGCVTPEFRLKRKLMLWRHQIEVREVRS